MHQLFVETVEWERIHVLLRGRIERSVSIDAPSVRLLFLENLDSGERVLLPSPEWIEDSFTVRLNVMQACAQYPLLAGNWCLFYDVPGGVPAAARMDPALIIRGIDYGGLFSAVNYLYWVVPATAPDSDGFCLAVNHRAMGKPDVTRPKLVRSMRRVLPRLRNSIYIAMYNTFRRLVRKNGRRVLFTSDSRLEMSGNLQHVHERMLARGLDADYKLYTAFKPSIRARRSFLAKLLFAYYLAIADFILLDDFHPMLYKVEFDPDVTIIQVWHASGAFKTVGYSRIGKPGGPSPFSSAHKNYTFAIVSSEHDVPFYAEAFGLPDERVIPTGIPRMDLFFDEEFKIETRELVHDAVPLTRGKKVILFAPTFRGIGPSNAYYDYDRIDFAALYRVCEELDAVCVFKMHPFVIEPLDIPVGYADRFIDATKSREINDFLVIADLVITDYSSLVFEYSTLNRPMLFFAYDLEDYISTRDFYEEFLEFVPGKIVRTFDEMLTAIRTGDFEWEKVEPFARMHLGHLDGGSTDRVIDQLILRSDAP